MQNPTETQQNAVFQPEVKPPAFSTDQPGGMASPAPRLLTDPLRQDDRSPDSGRAGPGRGEDGRDFPRPRSPTRAGTGGPGDTTHGPPSADAARTRSPLRDH